MEQNSRSEAVGIFQAVLKAVDPYQLVKNEIGAILALTRPEAYGRVLLAAFGKAAYPMARAISDGVGDILTEGVVITKYGHAGSKALPDRIHLFEAGHPLPDENGVRGTEAIIRMLGRNSGGQTLFLCLISGGGSALLVAPFGEITLAEKQEVTNLLLKSGAEIRELNTVRKHLSRVKGGRLADLAHPARTISLILSDVIGDPLDVIASGPTSPDRSTFGDALAVLDKYRLRSRVPGRVLDVLVRGSRGEIPETPKEDSPVFAGVENRIIGSNRKAIEVAVLKAKELGYEAAVLTSELRGEAREAAGWLARKAEEAIKDRRPGRKICLIAGGETTVTVRGGGTGGRNTEMALAFARKIRNSGRITFLSAGTDGTDGPTDAAGAIVDGETIPRAEAMELSPEKFLDDNDSYNFFKKTGELLITGPTGTNVMDIQIVLIR